MSFEEELNYFEDIPFYTKTNESLESIIKGLDINSNSNVLSILGSGDQVFSMIANGSIVTGIDIDKRQINLVIKRIKALKEDNFDEFIKSEYGIYDLPRKNKRRNLYFEKEFENIKRNISNLKLIEKPIDFFDYIKKYDLKNFNKVYISNIIEYNAYSEDNFKLIYEKFNKNTLIYSVYHKLRNFNQSYLKINLNLTNIAEINNNENNNDFYNYKYSNFWKPVVYEIF